MQDPLAISLPQTPVQIDHDLGVGIVAAAPPNPLGVKPPPVETLDTHDLNLVHHQHQLHLQQQQQQLHEQQLSEGHQQHQQQQQLLEHGECDVSEHGPSSSPPPLPPQEREEGGDAAAAEEGEIQREEATSTDSVDGKGNKRNNHGRGASSLSLSLV